MYIVKNNSINIQRMNEFINVKSKNKSMIQQICYLII